MAGQPGALRAERLLHDLDEDVLPFAQQRLDAGFVGGGFVPFRSAAAASAPALGARGVGGRLAVGRLRGGAGRHLHISRFRLAVLRSLGRVAVALFRGFQPIELVNRLRDVGHVEEPVSLETDVDEGRLHAGQDFRDPPLVDVADYAALPFPFDEKLGDRDRLQEWRPWSRDRSRR